MNNLTSKNKIVILHNRRESPVSVRVSSQVLPREPGFSNNPNPLPLDFSLRSALLITNCRRWWAQLSRRREVVRQIDSRWHGLMSMRSSRFLKFVIHLIHAFIGFGLNRYLMINRSFISLSIEAISRQPRIDLFGPTLSRNEAAESTKWKLQLWD